MPADKICEKLKKKDAQVCDLRYGNLAKNIYIYIVCLSLYLETNVCPIVYSFSEKHIDLNTVDLKKLRVRDLKKILNDWDEVCDGCLEKPDFIKRIEELKPLKTRTEL